MLLSYYSLVLWSELTREENIQLNYSLVKSSLFPFFAIELQFHEYLMRLKGFGFHFCGEVLGMAIFLLGNMSKVGRFKEGQHFAKHHKMR